ncbi:MAG: insulinase family protein [Clostridia bacterium]|nr:insulinase family protein [Clostridia bacterium]
MPNITRTEIFPGVNFSYIPEKKFKNIAISFSMFTPLNKNCASKNAVIPSLLTHNCKKHPSIKLLNQKLEELYGTSITPSVSKIGDFQALTITAFSADDRFLPYKSENINNLSDLLCDLIFNTNFNDKGIFFDEDIEREKTQIIEEIKSERNDKKNYARIKCEETMCKNEKYGINCLGTIEDAKRLNSKIVFEAWKSLLESASIEIVMIGNQENKFVIDEFKKRFQNIKRNKISSFKTKVIKKADEITQKQEHMDVTQCKLVMGFRSEIAKPNEKVPAVKVMNALLGGTPQSKLFLNVREKLSLCYYCNSRYNASKGIILIESGVEQQNIEKAKKEILEQIKDIQLGNFSDSQFEETKLYLKQSMKKIQDNIEVLGNWYLLQTFDDIKKSPEESIKEIENVSREDVINAALKISLDTIYILSGSKE